MRKHISRFGLVGAVLTFAIISGSTALALPSQATVHAQSDTTANAKPTDAGSQSATNASSRGATRLADAQLKSCQNREKAITNIMTRILDRGQKQASLFGTIASRTEAFYVKSGKTLSTYDALVADVNLKATTAQTALTTTTTDSTGFSCTGTDPKGFITTFKDSLKTEISVVQAYRTSVKNLIVGVKSIDSPTTNSQTTGGN
jgi:hypothetical protein